MRVLPKWHCWQCFGFVAVTVKDGYEWGFCWQRWGRGYVVAVNWLEWNVLFLRYCCLEMLVFVTSHYLLVINDLSLGSTICCLLSVQYLQTPSYQWRRTDKSRVVFYDSLYKCFLRAHAHTYIHTYIYIYIPCYLIFNSVNILCFLFTQPSFHIFELSSFNFLWQHNNIYLPSTL